MSVYIAGRQYCGPASKRASDHSGREAYLEGGLSVIMPRNRTYGSTSPRVRRGRLWLSLVLAAGAVTIWKVVFIGSHTDVVDGGGQPSQAEVLIVDSGGAKGGEAVQASPGVGAGDGGEPQRSHHPPLSLDLEGLELIREGVGEEGKGGDKTQAGDGNKRFTLKVGSVQLVPSEMLDFSIEDGGPGLMWLPIGLHDTASGDPYVTMCLMDYGHYQDNPSATPMFAHLHSFSKCGQVKENNTGTPTAGWVSLVRMSSLMNSVKEQGREPLPPKGFVYHETRCGSTLVANMLASLPPSRVFSESKPPTQVIRECMAEGCNTETRLKVFRNVVALMGRRRNGEKHEHLYFKFQNSKFISEISEAFPEVPWVFVFRDPVEVMVSNLKSFTGAPCVRIPRQEKLRKSGKVGKMMPPKKHGPRVSRGKLPRERKIRGLRQGPTTGGGAGSGDGEGDRYGLEVFDESVSWNGFTDAGFDSLGVPFSGMLIGGEREDGRSLKPVGSSKFKLSANMTTECADWLKALFVDYSNLPDAIPEHVFPEHFGMQKYMDQAVPDWRDLMFEAAGSYSKGSIKGKTREFAGDVEEKHKHASPLIVEASQGDGGLYDLYHSLDAMQKWRRPLDEEGTPEEKSGV